MKEMVSVILIGLALSLDSLSVALSIGMTKTKNKYVSILPFTIGIFHFFMPFLGSKIGEYISNKYSFNISILLGVILIIISIQMFLESRKKRSTPLKSGLLPILLLAISVSLDSFSTGIGLNAITSRYLLSFFIFFACSFCATYIGLLLGKYIKKKIGKYANILGSLILFILGIVYLCK